MLNLEVLVWYPVLAAVLVAFTRTMYFILTEKTRLGVHQVGNTAIVAGADFTGLCAAKVLSKYFTKVTVLTKSVFSSTSQPQIDALSLKQLIDVFGPALENDLRAENINVSQLDDQFTLSTENVNKLKQCILSQIQKFGNIELVTEATVTNVVSDISVTRAIGVEYTAPTSTPNQLCVGDVVIDALGKHSAMRKWIATEFSIPEVKDMRIRKQASLLPGGVLFMGGAFCGVSDRFAKEALVLDMFLQKTVSSLYLSPTDFHSRLLTIQ